MIILKLKIYSKSDKFFFYNIHKKIILKFKKYNKFKQTKKTKIEE